MSRRVWFSLSLAIALFFPVLDFVIYGASDRVHETTEIVTMELISPDGEKTVVKSIVGGAPVTITDKNGATWTVYIKAVETR